MCEYLPTTDSTVSLVGQNGGASGDTVDDRLDGRLDTQEEEGVTGIDTGSVMGMVTVDGWLGIMAKKRLCLRLFFSCWSKLWSLSIAASCFLKFASRSSRSDPGAFWYDPKLPTLNTLTILPRLLLKHKGSDEPPRRVLPLQCRGLLPMGARGGWGWLIPFPNTESKLLL